MRKKLVKFHEWTEEKLRWFCGRITPEKRLMVILVMLVIFVATSIYVITSAIYEIGKNEGRRIEIEHIEGLKLHNNNQQNFYENGREN